MKKLIGVITIIFIVLFVTIVVLNIWKIQIVSLDTIIRSNATLFVLGIAIVILLLIYGGFFRKADQVYNNKIGNRAHPKQ